MKCKFIGERRIEIFGIEEKMIVIVKSYGHFFFFILNSVFSFFLRICIYLLFLYLPYF